MPEAAQRRPAPGRFLVVALGPGPSALRLALPAERVRAVAPVPDLTRVPGAGPALAGLAAVRGGALPVLDLARLLAPDAPPSLPGRVVLAEAGEPVGLLVASVDGLTADPGPAASVDLPALVAGALPRRASGVPAAPAAPRAAAPPAPPVALVMLMLAGVPYALPLDDVDEVVAVPEAVAPAPGADPASLGAMPWRGGVLPLLSLSALLGRGPAAGSRAALVRGVGLVADRIGPVLRVAPDAIDPMPRALRRGGPAAGFARLDRGRTLVCILSAPALAGEAARLSATPVIAAATVEPVVAVDVAGATYGLPAAAVRAVTRAPAGLARVPGAPDGLSGMLGIRGGALPVLDLRRGLGLPPAEDGARRRLVIVESGGVQAGLLVDGAARLLRPEAGAIRPAPAGAGTDAAVTRVASLAEGPLPLIDPAILLDRAVLARSAHRTGGPS